MEVQKKHFDEIFEFKGKWHVPSKCGLRILDRNGRKVVIVTELYNDNPGSSVTYAGETLLNQICAARGLDPGKVIYIECNPDTKSRLSFFQEEYYLVKFPENEGKQGHPDYRKLEDNEIRDLIFNDN